MLRVPECAFLHTSGTSTSMNESISSINEAYNKTNMCFSSIKITQNTY